MPNRIIKESVCISSSIDALSLEAERFLYRLWTHADDFGWMLANLQIIRAKCFPLRVDEVTLDHIGEWLVELECEEMIEIFEYKGKHYLHFTNWEKHQNKRASKSKYEIADDIDSAQMISLDSSGYHVISHAHLARTRTRTRTRIYAHASEDADAEKQTKQEREFAHFWEAYPKKKSKAAARKAWDQTVKTRPALDDLLAKLIALKKSEEWTKEGGQYIPYPASWLRAGGWDDEVETTGDDDGLNHLFDNGTSPEVSP